MHGRRSNNLQPEPGEARGVETEVAPGADDGARGHRTLSEAELRIRAFVQKALGASQATRSEKAQARRKVRRRGNR